MQNRFLQKDGSLSIHGVHIIIAPARAFLLQAAGDGLFDHTFVVMDTHFAEEYALSEESRQFLIHCEYGARNSEKPTDLIRHMLPSSTPASTKQRSIVNISGIMGTRSL